MRTGSAVIDVLQSRVLMWNLSYVLLSHCFLCCIVCFQQVARFYGTELFLSLSVLHVLVPVYCGGRFVFCVECVLENLLLEKFQ